MNWVGVGVFAPVLHVITRRQGSIILPLRTACGYGGVGRSHTAKTVQTSADESETVVLLVLPTTVNVNF
jgi:hypothetical protein